MRLRQAIGAVATVARLGGDEFAVFLSSADEEGAQQAASHATDPFAGNVPYKIAGKCAANLLSFYYASAFRLQGGDLASRDMRARGCVPR